MYKNKYLKYKNKYLELKGGSSFDQTIGWLKYKPFQYKYEVNDGYTNSSGEKIYVLNTWIDFFVNVLKDKQPDENDIKFILNKFFDNDTFKLSEEFNKYKILVKFIPEYTFILSNRILPQLQLYLLTQQNIDYYDVIPDILKSSISYLRNLQKYGRITTWSSLVLNTQDMETLFNDVTQYYNSPPSIDISAKSLLTDTNNSLSIDISAKSLLTDTNNSPSIDISAKSLLTDIDDKYTIIIPSNLDIIIPSNISPTNIGLEQSNLLPGGRVTTNLLPLTHVLLMQNKLYGIYYHNASTPNQTYITSLNELILLSLTKKMDRQLSFLPSEKESNISKNMQKIIDDIQKHIDDIQKYIDNINSNKYWNEDRYIIISHIDFQFSGKNNIIINTLNGGLLEKGSGHLFLCLFFNLINDIFKINYTILLHAATIEVKDKFYNLIGFKCDIGLNCKANIEDLIIKCNEKNKNNFDNIKIILKIRETYYNNLAEIKELLIYKFK